MDSSGVAAGFFALLVSGRLFGLDAVVAFVPVVGLVFGKICEDLAEPGLWAEVDATSVDAAGVDAAGVDTADVDAADVEATAVGAGLLTPEAGRVLVVVFFWESVVDAF